MRVFRTGNRVERAKLCVKGGILVLLLAFAVTRPDLLARIFTAEILFFRVYHILWLAVTIILIKRMIPGLNHKITTGKIFGRLYRPREGQTPGSKEKLAAYTTKMNRGAARVALWWSLVIAATGALYLSGVIGAMGIFMVVAFFIFMDQFCISVWCPFEWIIKNKCCTTCRINNWGYLMAFAPLIYLPSFWTLTILALSAAVVIQWEYLAHTHPERLFELYNTLLTCRNCERRCPGRHGAAKQSGGLKRP